MVTVSDENLKVCRMNISEQPEKELSHLKFHYLVGTKDGVSHFTEDHTLGLFSKEDMLEAFKSADLKTEFDELGIFGRGLYIGKA